MTKNNSFKHSVRERMDITGEKYSTAYKFLDQKTRLQANFDLDDFIQNWETVAAVQKALTEPGMIVIGGSTGSGKTSIFHALVKEVLKTNQKVLLIRNVVEKNFSESPNLISIVEPDLPTTEDYQQADVIMYDELRFDTLADTLYDLAENKTVVITTHNSTHYGITIFDRLAGLRKERPRNEVVNPIENIKLFIEVGRLANLTELPNKAGLSKHRIISVLHCSPEFHAYYNQTPYRPEAAYEYWKSQGELPLHDLMIQYLDMLVDKGILRHSTKPIYEIM
jgi:hypothetical protein